MDVCHCHWKWLLSHLPHLLHLKCWGYNTYGRLGIDNTTTDNFICPPSIDLPCPAIAAEGIIAALCWKCLCQVPQLGIGSPLIWVITGEMAVLPSIDLANVSLLSLRIAWLRKTLKVFRRVLDG